MNVKVVRLAAQRVQMRWLTFVKVVKLDIFSLQIFPNALQNVTSDIMKVIPSMKSISNAVHVTELV